MLRTKISYLEIPSPPPSAGFRALSRWQGSPETPAVTDLPLPLLAAAIAAGRPPQGRRELEVRPSAGSSIIVPASPSLVPEPIDKSLLTIAEPKRLRDKAHVRFVASQPCLICGRQPCDPNHLRFAQPE